MKLLTTSFLGLVPVALGTAQVLLHPEQYDAGLFTPFEDLRALSSLEYTTLRHPQFPAHSVRIKESRICDGDVRCVPLTYGIRIVLN